MIESGEQFVEVAVAAPVQGAFTYRVPEALRPNIRAGMRVWVPFGPRRVTGYILGPAPALGRGEGKFILDAMDDAPLFPEQMIAFFRWISDYYLYPLGMVIQSALPSGLTATDYTVVSLTQEGEFALANESNSFDGSELLKALLDGPVPRTRLEKQLPIGVSRGLIDRLARKGWVVFTRKITLPPTRHKTMATLRLVQPIKSISGLSRAKQSIVMAIHEMTPTGGAAIPVKDLKIKIPTAASHLRSLEHAGFVHLFTETVYRDCLGEAVMADTPPTPTPEQQAVIDTVDNALSKGFSAFLLDGVTGSGKTEVYLRLSEKVMALGRSVLVLVPEIALISQMERRFRARFGDRLAVLHSGLTQGERFDQWMRIAKSEVPIALGVRSGIFAPFTDLGLIVVDEEHDGSYKQESGLRYNARDLAVLRARQAHCPVVLGSATPSVQSFYNVKTGKFRHLSLTHRVAERPLPQILTVDLKCGPKRDETALFFTPELVKSIAETLKRGEQSLLFLNRRGYSGLPICCGCGVALRCRHCDLTLTFHQGEKRYKCHYCGFSIPSTARCPECLGGNIRLLSSGTEKVEETVRTIFPQARVARMDRDTTNAKGSIVKMLKELRERRIDILIGTQMVAKGHDFPGITLVGILCADLSLNFPDFRAGERTFQLISQVAGRAGRGDVPGRVVLQTFNPGHFAVEMAERQDFLAFFEMEIDIRRSLGYPPFTRMIQMRIEGKDPKSVIERAQLMGNRFREEHTVRKGAIRILGPIEAAISRIAGYHRWQIVLMGSRLIDLKKTLRNALEAAGRATGGVRTVIDVDPYDML